MKERWRAINKEGREPRQRGHGKHLAQTDSWLTVTATIHSEAVDSECSLFLYSHDNLFASTHLITFYSFFIKIVDI